MNRIWSMSIGCVVAAMVALVGACRSEGVDARAVSLEPSLKIGVIRYTRNDIQANTFTGSTQDAVTVACDDDGGSVVAWHSRRQEAGNYGVYAQRIDSLGRRVGGEVRVNAYAAGAQTHPAVVLDSSGVWFAWKSFGQDGDRGGVFARRFDASLHPLTPDIAVNTSGRGQQGECAVASIPGGGVLVVWISDEDAGGCSVYARRIARNGQPLDAPFRLTVPAGVTDRVPSIGTSYDGSFVVAWERGGHIVGRRFDAASGILTPEFAISADDGSTHIEPTVAVAASGAFRVAWATLVGETYGISVRRYDASGNPVSGIERVDQRAFTGTTGLAIATRADGEYVVCWGNYPDRGHGTGLYGRAFDAAGAPRGDVFRVTRALTGNREIDVAGGARRLEYGDDGRITVAWTGDAGFGDKSAANVTILTPPDDAVTNAPTLAGEAVETDAKGASPHEVPTYTPRLPRTDRDAIAEAEGGGTGFLGLTDTGWNPPDPHVAVGPQNIVIIGNGAIAFFDKDGTLTFQDQIEDSFGFWGSVGATHLVFDPEVLYDHYSGRFMAMANERAPQNRPKFLLAVSDDSDPNGLWHKYRFDVLDESCGTPPCNNLIDSPNIAADEHAVYLTADFFGPNRYLIFMIDKAPLLTGGSPATTSILMPGVLSIGLAANYDSPPAEYMIESLLSGAQSTVRIRAVSDPLGTPQAHVATVSVPLYRQPENPPSGGTTARIRTFDSRFWSCIYRNGSLWATHHVGQTRVLQRWYQFRMNGWPDSGFPELVQWGEIDPGPGIRTYFGSIWADANDNAAMVFSRSSPTEFISMASAGRLAGDPLGEMRPSVILKESSSPLTATGSDRWGDYSAVVTDPAVDGLFWGHGEYVNTEWRTWVAPFSIADITPPTIVSADPFDGYIDPRRESTDGLTLDAGIDRLTLTFDDTVLSPGGLPLDAGAFSVSSTSGVAPAVASIDASANPTVEIVLDGVLPVQQYTTVSADVEDAAGNGATLSVTYGFLPGDTDQDGTVGPFDLLRFRQIVNNLFTPPQGTRELFIDTDRSGDIGPFDLLAFRQLINGLGDATQPWAGQSLP